MLPGINTTFRIPEDPRPPPKYFMEDLVNVSAAYLGNEGQWQKFFIRHHFLMWYGFSEHFIVWLLTVLECIPDLVVYLVLYLVCRHQKD